MAVKRKRKRSLFERIFHFRSKPERLTNLGTAEHLDIPPGCHFFVCDNVCRVILIQEDNQPRTTYIVGDGRHRVVIPSDVLVTVQCANDVGWQFELAIAAEIVDTDRMVVPLEEGSNKAHTDLRYMIDRVMRGHVGIRRPPSVEETDADRRDFGGADGDRFVSRYEQAALDEEAEHQRLEQERDAALAAKRAKPSDPTPAPAGSTP